MKIKNFKEKILSLVLCIAIILTYFSGMPRLLAEDNKIDLSNALHFIIRHWHTVSPDSKEYETEESNGNHFLIIEGYIVEKNGSHIFYVYKDKKLEEIKDNSKSDYIENVDSGSGTITLKVNPVNGSDGKPLEHLSGFSVSAGHSTVDTSGDDKITITYNKNVHLAKAHVFYSAENLMVAGSDDEAVFGTSESTGSDEKDTAFVYTYTTNDDNHKIGDVVKDEEGNPIDANSNLNDEKNAIKTKVYSTLEGLHTDRTASVNEKYDDGRTFNIDLESWFTNKDIPTVGLILDASGSMAFTSDDPKAINIKDLDLDESELKELTDKEIKKSEAETIATNSGWEKYFLDDNQISLILDEHNVDDSHLGISDYTYYIYDSRDATKEYVPIGYWDGKETKPITTTQNYFTELDDENSLIGYYSFTRGDYPNDGDLSTNRDWLLNSVTGKYAKEVDQISLTEMRKFEGKDAETGWPTSHTGFKMDSNGFNLTKSTSGIILDAVPKGDEFTISYTLTKIENENSKDQSNNENTSAEILYIGNTDTSSNNNYLRTYRAGNSSKNRYKGTIGNGSGDNALNYNNVFNSTTKNYITHVYKGGKLTTYLNGKLETSDEAKNKEKEVTINEHNIVFNGIQDNYNGADIILDDVYVFDSALSTDEIQKLTTEKTTEKEVAIENEQIVGMIDKKFDSEKGWYYINQGSDYSSIFNEKINTSKSLVGISTSKKEKIEFTDEIVLPENHDKSLEGGGTEKVYEPDEDTAIKFYIDEDGYLRCFFMSGTKQENIGTSYVYVSEDENYTKAEVLQRALGSFVTKLGEESPGSEVSAVRFSTNNMAGDLSKLVLLDWTDDTKESSSMLSLDRGENNGGFLDFTFSESGLRQYNYGLTGGTYTWTGLQAFKDNLSDTVDEKSKNKYIIIFTDGKDNEYNSESSEENNKAIELANELKDDGYTIYTVLLPGGPVKNDPDSDEDDYDLAKKFLMELSGTGEEGEKKDGYFYSTEELKNRDTKGNSVDEITNIFTNDILSQITDNLDNYSVKDYIDPRFDLVDANNNVWHLNSEGNVLVNSNTKYTLSDSESQEITLSNDSDVDKTARNAKLYYDKNKDMYYLVWDKQTIPGCTLEADRLAVWNARITVRAKDDFIGGNAVLTAGHDEKMNYVYSSEDKNASSGTDKAIRVTSDEATDEKLLNEYPSKGFPRVTVNVTPNKGDLNDEQTIYMGEELTENSIIQKIATKTKEKTTDNKYTIYYWEYLERYSNLKENSDSLDELAKKIVNGNSSGLNLDYYYLPDSNEGEKHNQTGTEEHKKDNLGNLTYIWNKGTKDYPVDGITKDTDTRSSSLSVTYTALPINSEVKAISTNSNSREDLTNELVKEKEKDDKIYDWDSEYKPVVGEEVNKETILTGNYTTNIVSGDIVLQMELDEKDKEILNGKEITYSADLYREYGKDGKKDKVGTLTATYNNSNTNNQTPELVTANISYEDDYDYAKTYGLPIGVYTLEENGQTNPGSSLLKFGDIKNIEITNENQTLFNKGTDNEHAVNYKAYADGNEAQLGTAYEYTKTYTDSRYALFQVKVEEVPTGSISIEKEAIGKNVDKDLEFEFTINLTSPVENPIEPDKITVKENDKEINNKVTWTENKEKNSVTGTFKLKHEEKITLGNIPENTKYTIEETNKHDYDLKAVTLNSEFKTKESSYNGKVTANTEDKWKFVNASPVSLPESGGIGTTIFYIIGGILLTISTIIFIYTRKKKHC